MALRPRKPKDPFEEEQLEDKQKPAAGDQLRIVAGDDKGIEGYVARVYKNGHVLAAFRPGKFMRPMIVNKKGWVMFRLMPGEFEVFKRKIIS